MSIKRLLTVSEVADSPFRSLVDVDAYLDKVQTKLRDLDSLSRQYEAIFARASRLGRPYLIPETAAEFVFKVNKKGGSGGPHVIDPKFYSGKFDKVVIPDLNKLAQNFSLVGELSEHVDGLEALYNTVTMNFKGVKGQQQTLQNVKAMHKDAATKRDKALKFLQTVGDKYAPEKFKQFVQAVMDYIATGIEYKTSANYLYGHVNKDKNLQFTYYVHLKGVRTEDGIEPSFFLVFTCILIPMQAKQVHPKLYVTVLHQFEAPGKFPLGKNVADFKGAALAIGSMMTMEQMSNSIGTVPHNLDPEKLTKKAFSVGSKVANILVDDNSIGFELLKSIKEDEATVILNTLYRELKSMMTKKRNAVPKGKLVQKDGRYVANFTVESKEPLDIHDLDFLKEDFGLSDGQMQQIRKTLFNGE